MNVGRVIFLVGNVGEGKGFNLEIKLFFERDFLFGRFDLYGNIEIFFN